MHVLLIDDEPLDRKVIKRNLAKSRAVENIVEADSVSRAQECMTEQSFDLILVDHRLTDGSALDVIEFNREKCGGSATVVVISGNEDEDLALDCIKAGAQDFLLKDQISATILHRAVIKANERHKLEARLKTAHEKLQQTAETDPLTGLYNRRFFDKALEDTIVRNQRSRVHFALFLIDLDNFKQVNDQLGHDVGDRLLQQVSQSMRTHLRQGDLLCRLGGDEFAAVINDVEDNHHLLYVIDRLLEVFDDPAIADIVARVPSLSLSIGIALFPENGADRERLLKCADLALYRTKGSGKNGYRFFDEDMASQLRTRTALESDIARAPLRGQFVLHYQPLWIPGANTIVGAEALLRWQHPEHGLLYPGDFLQIAEGAGMIDQIARWTIDTAFHQKAEWEKQFGHRGVLLSLGLNLTARQVSSKVLLKTLAEAEHGRNIDPAHIHLELTQAEWDTARQMPEAILEQLIERRYSLVLDDFGRDGTLIDILRRQLFHVVKIDGSIIQNALESSTTHRYLMGLCAMARAMDKKIYAKRVESVEQERWCESHGIEVVQGVFYAAAVSGERFTELLGGARLEAGDAVLRSTA